jgi:hypothetical protein
MYQVAKLLFSRAIEIRQELSIGFTTDANLFSGFGVYICEIALIW